MRAGVHLAPCLIVGVLLAGCGGGSSATTTVTSSAASLTSTAASATVPQPTASTATPHHSSAHLSAAAKGFLVRGADNSIPEYGKEAGVSERARAGAALATFLRARARGEWSVICAKLADATRKQLERLGRPAKAKTSAGGCGQTLAALLGGPASSRADPLVGKVVSLRVEGKMAFALFHGTHGSKYVMPMHSEGGQWKMTQTAPLPYPLG